MEYIIPANSITEHYYYSFPKEYKYFKNQETEEPVKYEIIDQGETDDLKNSNCIFNSFSTILFNVICFLFALGLIGMGVFNILIGATESIIIGILLIIFSILCIILLPICMIICIFSIITDFKK
jgi:hypothetical protein